MSIEWYCNVCVCVCAFFDFPGIFFLGGVLFNLMIYVSADCCNSRRCHWKSFVMNDVAEKSKVNDVIKNSWNVWIARTIIIIIIVYSCIWQLWYEYASVYFYCSINTLCSIQVPVSIVSFVNSTALWTTYLTSCGSCCDKQLFHNVLTLH